MDIREYLKEKRLITDGAMGTYFEKKYGENGRLAEEANLKEPEKILGIHREYIESGARLIRTNTFAANRMFFSDREKKRRILKDGYAIAKKAVKQARKQVWVAADIGPVTETGLYKEDSPLEEYREICDVFLEEGAELFLFETLSEMTDIREITEYIREKRKDAFIIVQFSVDKSGYTRHGLSLGRILSQVSKMKTVDACGFNCGVGAAHLYQLLKGQAFMDETYITALPNAGYPVELRGHTVYGENQRYFVEMMKQIAGLGIDILGGCCGTTPSYTKALAGAIPVKKDVKKKIRRPLAKPAAAKESEFLGKLGRGERPCIVELDPPFTADPGKVLDGARILKECGVELLTLSDSPMARARMDAGKLAARVQAETGLSVMPHITCRDKNVIGLRGALLGDYMNGIRHFLAVTGDPVAREARGQITQVYDFNSIRFMHYLSELNRDVFAEEPVVYGGALNYHGANPDAIAERMEKKLEGGCAFFLTQPVYSKEDTERIHYLKKKTGAKILCGIMPLVSYKNAAFVANEMPGIHVPSETVSRYLPEMGREEAEEEAVAISLEIAQMLYEVADGFYFMTPFNRAGLIARIIKQVKEKDPGRKSL